MKDSETITTTDLHVLYDLPIYNCLTRGSYSALLYEDGEITREYSNIEVAREAVQLATGLRQLGASQGDRVIVTMLNCPEVVISYQAIARAGSVIIPAMPLLKAPEIHYIAANSAASIVIASPILLPMLQEALQNLPTVQHVIVTDAGLAELPEIEGTFQLHRYSEVVARGAACADSFLQALPGVAPDED